MPVDFPRNVSAFARRSRSVIGIVALLLVGAARGAVPARIQSRPVHPLAMTPDGRRLVAVDGAAASLSVFRLDGTPPGVPILEAEIPVGLAPVSVALRGDGEAWVVGEASDSVTVVSLSAGLPVATIPVGDEPADALVVGNRVAVSVSRESAVVVLDAEARTVVSRIPLQGNLPRAMAFDPASGRLWVAFLHSGNGSSVLPADLAPEPPAPTDPSLPAAPRTSLIVAATDPRLPWRVADHDLAEIDLGNPAVVAYHPGVGTSLFDLAISPADGAVWVANTEAFNLVRFEPELKGRFVANRVTRLPSAGAPAEPWDLDGDAASPDDALAQPMSVVLTPDGRSVWVAAFGSDRVARLDPSSRRVEQRIDLRSRTLPGRGAGSRSMRGPRGLVLDEARGRLHVLNHLAGTVSTVDIATSTVVAEVPLGGVDPVPTAAREGAGFLFDARLSGNGRSSCGTCHIDGERDGLAWDLGDPSGSMVDVVGADLSVHDKTPKVRPMHPMKGPMVTQTLWGLSPTNRLHWRGDRATLSEFNPTFRALLGGREIAAEDMGALGEYLFGLRHHPNPNRNPDNSLPVTLQGGDPGIGKLLFSAHVHHCAVCHVFPLGSDNNVDDLRNFGGRQPIKTPPLATVYQRAVLDTTPGATNLSGFGLLHDGSGGRRRLPTVHFYELDLLSGQAFVDVTAFVLAFDTGTAPAVGRGFLVRGGSPGREADETERRLLESQATLGACDLVVRGRIGGIGRRFRFDPALGLYRPDRTGETALSGADLTTRLVEGDQLAFLAVPVGNGQRLGGDRDEAGPLDGDAPVPGVVRAESGTGLRFTGWTPDWLLESSDELGTGARWSPRLPEPTTGSVDLPPGTSSAFFRLRRTW